MIRAVWIAADGLGLHLVERAPQPGTASATGYRQHDAGAHAVARPAISWSGSRLISLASS